MSEQTVDNEHPECHCHEDCAQGKELEQWSSVRGLNELRHERHKKDRQFRVQDIKQEGLEDDGEGSAARNAHVLLVANCGPGFAQAMRESTDSLARLAAEPR